MKITKLGLAKLYHARDHGSKSYIWLCDFDNFCSLGGIFGHFYGVVGPYMTYNMKGGVVGYRKITKLGLAQFYHARDHGYNYNIWVCYLDTGSMVLI